MCVAPARYRGLAALSPHRLALALQRLQDGCAAAHFRPCVLCVVGLDRSSQATRENGRETLTGTIERVVYHDVRTRYTVLRLIVPGRGELVSAVGRTHGV